MDKYFKERLDEIQLRTEQMAERKTYESEIDSLEEKLKGLESNYQRLKKTWKSNLGESALKRVDLAVAKEAHAYAEDMLNKKQALLVEEKQKLDDLHWQVWKEEIKLYDEMGKCVAENDSVSFLNEYPRVLKMQKYAFLGSSESNDEIKQLVAEHPEVKQLTAEIAVLETDIKKAEESCLAGELEKVLTEIRELTSDDNYKGDETRKLIEALERSHRERISLEREIAEIENRRIEVSHVEAKLNMSQKKSEEFPRIKSEPQYHTSGVSPENDKKPLKSRLEIYHDNELQVIKEKDKKLQARKWYEEYARQTAVATEENYSGDFYSPLIHWDSMKGSKQGVARITLSENCSYSSKLTGLSTRRNISLEQEDKDQKKDDVENANPDDPPKQKFKFHPKSGAKRKSSDHSSSGVVKSRFFDEKSKNLSHVGFGSLSTLTPRMNLNPEKKSVNVKAISEKNPKAIRKFEPLVATPNTFFKSATETALDNTLVQSSYDERPSTSAQDVIIVKKIVKFAPKRPSNICKKSAYRQTKLDDFDNFMLPDNKYIL